MLLVSLAAVLYRDKSYEATYSILGNKQQAGKIGSTTSTSTTTNAVDAVSTEYYSFANIQKRTRFVSPGTDSDHEVGVKLSNYFAACYSALQREFPMETYTYNTRNIFARNRYPVIDEKNEANRLKVEALRQDIPLPLELVNGQVHDTSESECRVLLFVYSN